MTTVTEPGPFRRAGRQKRKLRLVLEGPPGSGKTLTALRLALAVARHEGAKLGREPRVAVIDTEHGSASLYQGERYDGGTIDFDVVEQTDPTPIRYAELVTEAGRCDYDVVVIDSLSHAWSGIGRLVHITAGENGHHSSVERVAATSLQLLIETLLQSAAHLIVTLRTGSVVGQMPDIAYEFDIVLDLDAAHVARVSKSRCSRIADSVWLKPGAEFLVPVMDWLERERTIPSTSLDSEQSRAGDANGGDSRTVIEDAKLSVLEKARRRKGTHAPTCEAVPTPEPAPHESAAITATVATPDPLSVDAVATSADGLVDKPAKQPEPRLQLVSAELLRLIEEAFTELGVHPQVQQSCLEQRGAPELRRLGQAQGAELWNKLCDQAYKRRGIADFRAHLLQQRRQRLTAGQIIAQLAAHAN